MNAVMVLPRCSESMRRLAYLATILTVTVGCDKAKGFVRAGQAAGAPSIPAGSELDLRRDPVILFQVFGEANDPRIIPVAAVEQHQLKTIELEPASWRRFDAMMLRSGTPLPVYKDGKSVGYARVTQGMWERPEDPLYSLPGCRTLTPLAAAKLDPGVTTDFTVELLASNKTLGRQSTGGRTIAAAEVRQIAKALGYAAGGPADISRAVVDSLAMSAVAIQTGATKFPTIVASFTDPMIEYSQTTVAHTAHILLIADADASGHYHATYMHRLNAALGRADFRRYFDHLDVTGDGTDEIVLEGWRYGGDTFLSVLSFTGGAWRESFRSRTNWCLDQHVDR